MKKEKNNKSKVLKTILIFLGFSILVWILIGMFGLGAFFKSVSKTIKVEEYQTYLEDKYGKDKNFRMVEEGSGDLFQTGNKQYWFVSNETNDERFSVDGSFSNGKKVFTDNYIAAKYKEQLELYYKQLFDSALGVDCKIEDTYADSTNLNPNASFEEYLKHEDLDLYIDLDSLFADFDRETLKVKTKELIESNGIKNVKQISSSDYIIYKRLEVE